MSNDIKVSIIIRCKNEERFIKKVLEAVFNQVFNAPFEVIMIDSGSKDKTLEVAKLFPVRIYKIPQDKFNFGFALNYCVELARGKYIVNLSAHSIPADSYWLHNLIEPLEIDPIIVATYGRQESIKGLNPIEELELLTIFPLAREKKALANFSNSNCAIIKEKIKMYPFDEEISWAEDFLWQKQLPPDYTIKYIYDACVYHSHPLLINYWIRRSFYNGLAVQYLDKIFGISYLWKEIDISFPGLFIKFLKQMMTFSRFFLKNGYYGYILIFPFFNFCRIYFYLKGLRKGEKIYSHHYKKNRESVFQSTPSLISG